MQTKKRLSRRDPSYYVPLPYAMAIKRCLDEDVFDLHLFNGMQLGLKMEGIINTTIAITAYFDQQDRVIGYIPKGMVSRIEGLVEHEERIVVTMERMRCDRLRNSFWICFDELHDVKDLGIIL
ncbi:MAG: hypothetical protein HQ500_05135 [Flavobacteriales bacterium]|nr:hypothetical protein [Flavobacteriales bacterium]